MLNLKLNTLKGVYFLLAVFLCSVVESHARVYPREYYVELNSEHAEFLASKGFNEFRDGNSYEGGLFFSDQESLPLIDFTTMINSVELREHPLQQVNQQQPNQNPVIGFVGTVPRGNGDWETWFISTTNKKIKLAGAAGTLIRITGIPLDFIPADEGVYALSASRKLWFISNNQDRQDPLLFKESVITVSEHRHPRNRAIQAWAVTDDGNAALVRAENEILWVPQDGSASKVVFSDQTILANLMDWMLVPEGLLTMEGTDTEKKVFLHRVDVYGNVLEKKLLVKLGPNDQAQLSPEGILLTKGNPRPSYWYVTKSGHQIAADNTGPRRAPLTQQNLDTLLNYGVNLTDPDRVKTYDQIFGRDEEMLQVMESMGARTHTGVLLYGRPGVGKTSLVRGISMRVAYNDRVPSYLAKTQIVEIQFGKVKEQASSKGIEVIDVFSEIFGAARDKNVILFMDEFDKFVDEAGKDFSDLLRPELEAGHILLIAAADSAEKAKVLDEKKALMARFKHHFVRELEKDMTMFILRVARQKLERFYLVHIGDEALQQILFSGQRFFPHEANPRKALRMLEELAAYYSWRLHPRKYDDIQDVSSDEVGDFLEVNYNILNGKKYEDRVTHLVALLDKEVVAQHDAKQAITESLQIAVKGLNDPNHPLGTFLFVGPTGVGKSYTAQVLADILQWPLLKHDMQTLVIQDLVDQVRGTPNAIIVLEDIHNSGRDGLRPLMPLLEEGEMVDPSTGEPVNFKNTLVIMTSNHAAETVLDNPTLPVSLLKSMMKKQLTTKGDDDKVAIPPEVWGRIDEVVIFRGLTENELFQVGDILTGKIKKRVKNAKGIDLFVSTNLRQRLAKEGFDSQLGARPLQDVLEDNVTRTMALKTMKIDEHLKLKGDPLFGKRVCVSLVFDNNAAEIIVVTDLDQSYERVRNSVLFQDQLAEIEKAEKACGL